MQPVDIILEDRVFQDKTLLASYLASLHDSIPMEEFGGTSFG